MISGLSIWMEEKGYKSIMDFCGKALTNIVPAEDLERDFKVYPKIDYDKCVSCGRCYVSCFDGAHQAITWDVENRKVEIDEDKCVGCQLCLHVCPVANCITPGKVVFKPEDQFGLGSEAKYVEGGPNKRDIIVGQYDE